MVNQTTFTFVRLQGTHERMRRLVKDLSGRATVIVRGVSDAIFIAIPPSELGWVDKVAKDIGVEKKEVQSLPKYDTAPCGVLTVDVARHKGRCKKCQALRPAKPHDGKPVTVVKVEGLHDLTLNGLVGVMKGKMDEILNLAQEYETTIKAIEKIPELQAQMDKLREEAEQHRQALKYFTEQK